MIVFCEECGEKYVIDPEKINGDSVSFKCRMCGELITVKRPAGISESGPDDGVGNQGED